MMELFNLTTLSGVVSIYGFKLIMTLGVMILLGHLMGKAFNKIKMPEVTGYIVTGILLNIIITLFEKHIMKVENPVIVTNVVGSFQVVVVIALSFVSFMIGTQISKYKVKKFRKTFLPVVTLQLIFVIGFTTFAFMLIEDVRFALLIGAISAATAPAAIIEITGKYKTKGALTDVLSSIVAIDNIVGITYFFIVLGFVQQTSGSIALLPSIEYLIGAGAAIVIGVVAGFILVLFDKYLFTRISDHDETQHSYLVVMVGMILITALGAYIVSESSLFEKYHVSPFITTLIAGIVFTNFIDQASNEEQSHVMHQFLPPLLTSFFVIAGMELDITKLFHVTGLFALVYVVTHAAGKFLGAYLGTRVNEKVKPKVKKHLPFAVLTQGGFEIYLAGIASKTLASLGIITKVDIFLVVLTSVLIFELFAPLLLTKALFASGEVKASSIEIVTDQNHLETA